MNGDRIRRPISIGPIIFVLCITATHAVRAASTEFNRAWGSRYQGSQPAQLGRRHRGNAAVDWIKRWNEIAINASGLDHTPVQPGDARKFGEQLGPGRSSRAMAIVHIAIFEAVNAIAGGYESYLEVAPARGEVSLFAAVATAAHDTLIAVYPSQRSSFDNELAADLAEIADGQAKTAGIELGRRSAASILAMRAADHAQHDEPKMAIDFITSEEPGKWRQDPISLLPLALGAHWGELDGFALSSGDQFRAPPPPAITSSAYERAYAEVKQLGGDGTTTPTQRTTEQTEIGIYWAYDGTPSLCAPPRLYNQIAVQIADLKNSNHVELARLLALASVAMADAGVAIWESKYFYQYWRPITGIREADSGTGPTGFGDGNVATEGDVSFTPLGAPASNLAGPNFTPPFPSYPSGHAGFGAALFQVLRRFYGTDNIPFTFVSDEFNGVTKDSQGNVRPLMPRTFSTLSQAEEENGQSRIYLGIHWSFDKTEGITQGRRVADFVMQNIYTPARRGERISARGESMLGRESPGDKHLTR